MRNPNWARDELILALDVYFRVDNIASDTPEIVELSELLRSLPIHSDEIRLGNFRNSSGVAMKLHNFKRLDPNYPGAGLDAGAYMDEVVWSEFSKDKSYLQEVADAIRRNYSSLTYEEIFFDGGWLVRDYPEGYVLGAKHAFLDSDNKLRKLKYEQIGDLGITRCEVCGLDSRLYGNPRPSFFELHANLLPRDIGLRTPKVEDVSAVCPTCHKVLHIARPLMTAKQLKMRVG